MNFGFDGFGQGFNEQLEKVLMYDSFSRKAQVIMQLYDFNDVTKAKEYAKSQVPHVKDVDDKTGINTVKNLFNHMVRYLQTNCKPIRS